MESFKYVIIGNSAAGIATLEGIREADAEGSVAIISDEDMLCYSRCLTSYYIKGQIGEKGLLFRSEDFYDRVGATPFLGKRAVKVDPDENWVELDDGTKLSFEKLMMATGARAVKYDMPGNDKKGVFVLRTYEDAQEIAEMAEPGRTAAVLGGGLVGLKVADALHHRGMNTQVLVTSPQVMSQTIDKEGADIVRKHLEEHGIVVRTETSVKEIMGGDRVESLRLSSGEVMDCDMVIFGKGVYPNIHLAVDAGLETNYGIIVDETLRTTRDHIFAAGDVAEANDLIQGGKYIHAIWPNAMEQGRIAGRNMAGEDCRYQGGMGMNSVEILGLPSITIGVTKLRKPDPSYESLSWAQPEKKVYRKIMLRDGVLVGAVLIGNIESAGVYAELIRQRADVSQHKDILLDEGFDFAKVHDLDLIDEGEMFVEAV
ncbi:MAG: NAD(P)/FAD-dependent oxidoreductase [Methanomassiliicoccales archaeon]